MPTNHNQYAIDSKHVANFVLGGRALFTVENMDTGKYFTYKVNRAKGDNENRPWFVSVMTGPDNESSYSYIGVIFPGGIFRWTAKSRLEHNAQSVRAFAWLYNSIICNARELPSSVNFMHHGRCCRCNRVLTTPVSIQSGIGPICATRF